MRKLLTFLTLMVMALVGMAAPVRNMSAIRIQPNGDTLRCWVTGDEFFHRLHDAEGYTIVQDVKTGIYVYATVENGLLVPTEYVPGRVQPAQVGLTPNLMPSAEELQRLHHEWDIPEKYRREMPKTSGVNHGTLNNLVIFIRFADESSCTSDPFDTVDAMFNDSTAGTTSMYNYFKSTSYNKIHINTLYRPQPVGDTVLSFQDSYSRSYYMPYSATNPNGYADYYARMQREFSLLERAVNWVNANCPIDANLNLDMDNDGYVDNICFVLSGSFTGWDNLLWPHKWSLYDRYVAINGKRVYTFNLQLAGSGSHFSVSTFCHEMTHTLGCPDLYHYYNFTAVSPAGSWDLMCSNQTPPQQTNSLFKFKYLNWFDSIPQITHGGTYTMQSLASGPNGAYKIASRDPHQWYILEYRNTSDSFDASIPNRGMLIWRYNDHPLASNAYFDDDDTLHELWLFRPFSSDDLTSGNVAQAGFGLYGRNTFSADYSSVTTASNPYPYLCDGTPDTSFSITNIQVSSDYQSVSFTFTPNEFDQLVRDTTYIFVHDTLYYDVSDTVEVVVYDTHFVTPPYCRLFVSANEPDRGRVSGNGRFPEGTAVEVAAIANPGYAFDHWLDGSRENPRRVVVKRDMVVLAFFVAATEAETPPRKTRYYHDTIYVHDTLWLPNPQHDTVISYLHQMVEYDPTTYYTLTVLSSDSSMGVVAGSGRFPRGTAVEVAALASPGYRLGHWEDNTADNPKVITVVGDMTFRAYFTDEGTEEVIVAEGGQVKIYAQGNYIVVEADKAQPVVVYNILGQQIYHTSAPQNRTQVEALRRGLYLVKVGEAAARKVVVLGK